MAVGNYSEKKGELAASHADIIFHGGKIITVDDNFSIAEAVAISFGRFLAVGSNKNTLLLADEKTQVIDLKGKTVIPGLIDTHCHMEKAGEAELTVPLGQQKTVDEALEAIRRWAQRTKPGEWVIGSMAFSPLSQLAEKRFLTRWEIDRSAPDNPVYLPADHMLMCNSYAMRLARITRDTPDPAGGTIEKDPATGEPTGLLVETAKHLVTDIIPPRDFSVQVNACKQSMNIFNSAGLTSVVVGIADPESAKVYEYIWKNREATVRVDLMYCPTGETTPLVSLDEWERKISECSGYSSYGDDFFGFAGIKLMSDGGMTLKTAYLREPYHGADYYGMSLIPQGRLNQLVAICHKHGWRVGIHAVGDAAIDSVLEAFEYADKIKSIKDRRFILLHASLMQPDQMKRAAKLGVRVDLANAFMWNKAATTERYLGTERSNRACPTRWLMDNMGIENVGVGPDFPFTPLSPFITMYVMVTRKDINGRVYGANQAVSREEALRLYTIGSAHYTFDEDIKGSIEPGKLADLLVISDDLLTSPEESIKDIHPLLAVVGGEIVYRRE